MVVAPSSMKAGERKRRIWKRNEGNGDENQRNELSTLFEGRGGWIRKKYVNIRV